MNDFTEGHEIQSQGMVAETGMVALLNKSEIDQQIATAHRYPRSLKKFRDTALQMVTLTEDIARECIYALPRDGKTIEGPSARFAEVIASAWGNSRAGARVVNDQGDFVTAQGVFHDLEQNVAITYEVQRRIVDKYGKRYKPDMIGVTANAACSIALRNAILKGVPKAFWAALYQAARKTVMGDFKTLANRRSDAIAQFQAYGVTKEMILKVLGLTGVEDIGLEQLVTLGGILTAIQEGDTTPEQAFAMGDDKGVQGPKAKNPEPPKSAAQPPAPEAQPAATEAPQPQGDSAEPPKAEPQQQQTTTQAPAGEQDARPMSQAQRKILAAKMKNNGVTAEQLNTKFGKGLDEEGWLFSEFQKVSDWLSEAKA